MLVVRLVCLGEERGDLVREGCLELRSGGQFPCLGRGWTVSQAEGGPQRARRDRDERPREGGEPGEAACQGGQGAIEGGRVTCLGERPRGLPFDEGVGLADQLPGGGGATMEQE